MTSSKRKIDPAKRVINQFVRGLGINLIVVVRDNGEEAKRDDDFLAVLLSQRLHRMALEKLKGRTRKHMDWNGFNISFESSRHC